MYLSSQKMEEDVDFDTTPSIGISFDSRTHLYINETEVQLQLSESGIEYAATRSSWFVFIARRSGPATEIAGELCSTTVTEASL